MTGTASFLEAVLDGDTAAVARQLAGNPSLVESVTDETFGRGLPPGSTPLHIAVRHGHGELVDTLLAAGARIDARNREGRDALHDALEFDHRMRDRLVARGATIDVCHAAFLDMADRVRDLVLESRARVSDRSTGVTPLGWACYGNAARAARVLLDLGAPGGAGELVRAAQVGGVKVGRVLLLDRDADVNALHDGFNALHAALTTPLTDDLAPFVALLVEYGADVNAPTASGRRPLDLLALARALPGSAARAASLDACEALLREAGARHTA